MTQYIAYKTDEGNVGILVPAPECLAMRTMQEIALKDVPAGKPFKIINLEDMPNDLLFFDAWEVDEALLTDGIGAEYTQFPLE